ncbi:unnamed protein product [Darwinula stevensoni]|uniref:Uncharacterized protein n=1 Tax=Darwinula stevensoni TaxID=69355 RepID=A0A7R8ZY61_9CRUS|nr:unnamed protein product [Darwinula stevensoni]CAG0879781.1 unnamed protein product [Darwinula stevensoni]
MNLDYAQFFSIEDAVEEKHPFLYRVKNITVPFGEKAELLCIVDNLGFHKMMWIRNETVLTENEKVMLDDARVSVSTRENRTWSLHIEHVSSGDVGCYTCQVDELKSVGCILAKESPVLIEDKSSGDVTVREWDDARLSCRARGNPQPEIQWTREDDRDILQIGFTNSTDGDEGPLFLSDLFGTLFIETKSVKGEVLELSNIHRGEAGPYVCTATNGVQPDVSKRIQVNVQYAPSSDEHWAGLAIEMGEEARLECTMSGFPKPKITWTFNGMHINSTVEEEELEVGFGWRQHKSWKQTLVIPAVEAKHYGLYECHGMNSLGKSTSHMHLQREKKSVTASSFRWEGTALKRTPCITDIIYISWLPAALTSRTDQDEDNEDKDLDVEDTEDYFGTDWLERSLALRRMSLIRHTLSAPENVKARAISLTTLMIQWDELEKSHLDVMAYKVYYTSNPAMETSMWSSQLVGGNNFTTISGLTPFTVYGIRVEVYTSLKRGHASPPIQTKTQYGVPSMLVNLTFMDGNATTIKLNWDLQNEPVPIISYELYWNDTYKNEVHSKSIPVTKEYNLTGLYPNSQYFIWLSAKSKNGEGAPTPPMLVSTQTYVLSEPDEVETELVNSTSVFFKWKPPKKKEQHPLIAGYRISIQETDDLKKLIGDPLIYSVRNGSVLTYLATDLQPDTNYEAQVTALMRQGNGTGSSLIFFKTPGGVPSRPILHVRLLDVKTNGVAAEATWAKPSITNGKIQGWRLRYEKRFDSYLNLPRNEQEKSHMKEIILKQPDTINYRIENLDKGCEYEFRLSGCDDAGCGQEAMAHMRTPEGPPTGPPTNISFRFITSDIIAISCEEPTPLHSNGRILGYTLQLHKTDTSLIWEKNFSTPELTVTGQGENIPFYFRIRAYTSKGAGPFSEKMHVSTTPEIIRAPISVQAMATSKDSLEVWWDEVPRENIGGYRIYYNMAETENPEQWIQKDIPCASSAKLQNLVRLAEYSIRVAARTKDVRLGFSLLLSFRVELNGEVSQHMVSTQGGLGKLSEMIRVKVSFEAVKEFVDENGATQMEIIPPRIIFLNRTDTSYTLHGLSPFTTYRVNVSAVPPKKDYRPPASIYVTTKMDGLTHSHAVETSTSLFTELPPEDRPYIAAKFIGDVPYIFNLGDSQTFNSYLNKPLPKSKRYKIFLRAYVDSPTEPNQFGTSNMSSFLSLDMTPIPPGAIPNDRLLSSATAHLSAEKGNSLWVIGPVIATLLLVSCLAFFIYLRRRRILQKTQESTAAFNPLIHSDIFESTPSLGE